MDEEEMGKEDEAMESDKDNDLIQSDDSSSGEDDALEAGEASKKKSAQVYVPGTDTEPSTNLECDESAYVLYQQAQTGDFIHYNFNLCLVILAVPRSSDTYSLLVFTVLLLVMVATLFAICRYEIAVDI